MADKYAYRASDELARALRMFNQRWATFYDQEVGPFPRLHNLHTAWRVDYAGDAKCLGFALIHEDDEIPKGLSASKDRDYLIPRGKAGDPWRAHMKRLNSGPKRAPILKRFGVEPMFLVIDTGRGYHIGLHDTPDGYYATWGCENPNPGPHLTPVRLSEFYLAKEREDARRAAMAPAGAVG